MSRLLSSGRLVFSQEEARIAIGKDHRALLSAAERQQRRHALISPRRGFYVSVPPQYLSWGAPPPSWYIDDLMRHKGHPYYVGLLQAAELRGAHATEGRRRQVPAAIDPVARRRRQAKR